MVKKFFEKEFLFILVLVLILIFFTGCSSKNREEKQESKTVNIVYVEWDSEIASSHVVKAVIEEKLGYECELLSVPLTALWESIAAGDQDATVAAWLPSLQKNQQKKYKKDVKNLGPHLKGTRTGLVVPNYVNINSIKELVEHAQKFDNKIIGIDPDAGIMEKTKTAIEEYELSNKFDLVSGSGSTMTTILKNAIENEEWIVITGWTPHWKFVRWDLKYLNDPKNIYADQEHISTIVRKDLKKDMPDVYHFLDNFQWQTVDMEEVMLLIQNQDNTPEEAAKIWLKRNEDLVENWIN